MFLLIIFVSYYFKGRAFFQGSHHWVWHPGFRDVDVKLTKKPHMTWYFCGISTNLKKKWLKFVFYLRYTLPKTNIAPENGWLEYCFPFGDLFSWAVLVSGRVPCFGVFSDYSANLKHDVTSRFSHFTARNGQCFHIFARKHRCFAFSQTWNSRRQHKHWPRHIYMFFHKQLSKHILPRKKTGFPNPIPSMYGIFTYIWLFLMVKYGKCR